MIKKTKNDYCEIPVRLGNGGNPQYDSIDSIVGVLKIRNGIAHQIALNAKLLKTGIVLYPLVQVSSDDDARVLSLDLGNLPQDPSDRSAICNKKLEDAQWLSNGRANAKRGGQFDGKDFYDCWHPTLRGKIVSCPVSGEYCFTDRSLAIDAARRFRQRAKKYVCDNTK